MKRSSFLLGFLFAPCALLAQSSAYQSADGNTSIFLDNAKGSLIFNVSNTQFDFGYLHEAAGKSFLYGFDVTGKPSSDFASLFQNAKLPAGAGGSASLGRHKLFSQALTHQNETSRLRDDWVLLQVGFTRSSFETAGDALSEPIKRSFNGYKSLAVYDALVNAPGATLLLGVATGVQQTNNLDALKSAVISTPLAISAPGISPFQVSQQASSGYFGNYKSFIGAPLYTDAVWVPKSLPWLDLDAFTRSNLTSVNRYIEGGLGLFIAKRDNPTQVLGGISVGWKNGSPTIAFVTGWSF